MWRALAGSFHGRLRQRLDLRVALLGSCHVARHRHHRGATESLLESILESPVIRLGFRDRWSRCCGHAGGMASTFEDVALEASRTLLREAQLLGADAILSETPGCTDHLRRAREADETLPEPLGLVDLIERALA